MSIKVMSHVWDHSDARLGARLVLLAVADFANDAGMAWPSVATLAEKSRLSTRQVQRILRELVDGGDLTLHQNAGPKGCHLYQIAMTNASTDGRQIVRGDKLSGATNPAEGVTFSTKTVSKMSPEPSVEPSENHQSEAAAGNVTFLAAPASLTDEDAPTTTTTRKRKSETTFPEDMVLNRDRLAYAVAQGMSEQRARRQFERFHNQALATDRRQKDWEASWRNWVLGEIDRYGRDVRTFNEGDDPDINPDTGKPYRYNDARSRKVFVG